MLSKTFINKCLFFLNKVAHKYSNVSYSITRFDTFITLSCQIWDKNTDCIIETFITHISSEQSFVNMTIKVEEFIDNNKKLLC